MTNGRVYTFYSYKGGVGRSMTLANVAALLSLGGKRVLVVDWDLEAPGLERYFEDAVPGIHEAVAGRPGIVDLATAVCQGTGLTWRDCVNVMSVPDAPAPLHLITAGDRTGDYVKKLQGLDWDQLFIDNEFGLFLESIRDEWRAEYDFVLVDSRTGVTDIGGICTIYLPDGLVALFTANHQSIQGTADVLTRVREARSDLPVDRAALIVLPLAARDEGRNEYQQSLEWRRRYVKAFGRYFEDFLPRSVSAEEAFEVLRVPNVPYWSFGERLPVLEEAVTDPSSLSFYYSMVMQLLATDFSWRDSIPTSRSEEGRPTGRRLELPGARGVLVGDGGTQHNYYFGPQHPTLEDYRAQFRSLAPAHLRGREGELALLEDFCGGVFDVLWLRGGPWTGKTALLARFAADPPANVEVVAFFVAQERDARSTAEAFAGALIDQLSSVLGVQRSEFSALSQNLAVLDSLVRAAATEMSRLGRTLVLMVDGLDEDMGPESVPQLPSIASLLPVNLAEGGLKMMVSSRNTYRLPDDVPAHDPLRIALPVDLSPAVMAPDPRAPARHEIRNLLLRDQWVQDLIGLVTVSAGKLSAGDAADLIGMPAFRLDEYLSGTVGRAVVSRDGTLSFAHEALHEAAELALGPRLLRRYRQELQA